MLEHSKGKEPRCLKTWQATPGADWSSLHGDDKQTIREAVCRDQGGLCAYCERRIKAIDGSTFIEHWHPRSTGERALLWRNLLGVCSGKTGDVCHCDKARQPNSLLFLNPVAGEGPNPRSHLRYLSSGRIEPREGAPAEVRRDIDEHLNLNAPPLIRHRKVILEELVVRLERAQFSPSALKRELELHTLRAGAKLPEQAEAVRYQIERWLRKKQVS